MPPRRATRVRSNKAPKTPTGGLEYPSSSEINVPPTNFDEYIRCFYGVKGIGKSTLAASFPNYLTLMMETRRRNLKIRQLNLDKHTAAQIRDGADDIWEKIKLTTPRWIDDDDVAGINFDSVDLTYECCVHSVCASHDINKPGDLGKNSSDIWIEIRDEWATYFDALAATDLGINFLSHIKEREIDTVDGTKLLQQSPSCAPACLQYIRQACDFVFFYGYYEGQRTICLRDETNSALCAVGTSDYFLQPDGTPIKMLEIPNLESKTTPYERLLSAFNNQEWDIETPEDERSTTTKKPIKRRRR